LVSCQKEKHRFHDDVGQKRSVKFSEENVREANYLLSDASTDYSPIFEWKIGLDPVSVVTGADLFLAEVSWPAHGGGGAVTSTNGIGSFQFRFGT